MIPQVKGMPSGRVWPGLMGVRARDMRLYLGGVMGQRENDEGLTSTHKYKLYTCMYPYIQVSMPETQI